jgi:anaerobic selenocysteine-containing dehydrogenase
MVQREVDPLTGASRDAVLISPDDAARLGAANGTRLRLISSAGVFEGRAFLSPIRRGNLAVHWPEGLPLVDASAVDPESGEPDYNAVVRLEVLPVD